MNHQYLELKDNNSATPVSTLNETSAIKLTAYSHGAGCGCKISPAILDRMLHTNIAGFTDPRLLVGNDKRDDAAVLDLGNGTAIISTTDFFMPIVDDAYDFGRIASANAISDVYAMGGRPVLAIAILGWPIDKLAPEVAQRVLEGSRAICAEAGITLAGGHSIDCPEPVFGLAVTGIVDIPNLKKNATASAGAELYLTKGLGVGILSTAQKKGILQPADAAIALKSMVTLNKAGEIFGKTDGVLALTDVTGFGLLGHLAEMCEGSGCAAEIEFDKIPQLTPLQGYLDQQCIPGGAVRNFKSYGHKIAGLDDNRRHILCDPQTSGGLLVAVDPAASLAFGMLMEKSGFEPLHCRPIGRLTEAGAGALITVR